MDAFYASVEQRDNPALRGKPVAVGGDPTKRGVVAAASYEARTFGVRSAIPMSRAVRLCPSLIIVRPDFQKYRTVSQQVFAIYRERHAAGRTAVARRGLSRRHRERLGRTAGHDGRQADQAGDPRDDAADGVGRCRAEQVPRQDRVGLAEAGRPDGDCARADRDRSCRGCRSTRSGASGRRPPSGCASTASTSSSTCARDRSTSSAQSSAASAEWLRDLAHGRDDRAGRSQSRNASRAGSECTYEKDLTDMRAHSRRDRRDGARRGALAGQARALRAHRRRSRCATTTSRRSRAATANRRRRATPTRSPRARVALLDKTEAGRRAGAAARRRASTTSRNPTPRSRAARTAIGRSAVAARVMEGGFTGS